MVCQRRRGSGIGKVRNRTCRGRETIWSLLARSLILGTLIAGPISGPAAATPSAPPATSGAADPASICEWTASEASRRTGVPVSVLKAISLNETGRKRAGAFRPWPWTVNMEGKGLWFDSAEAALAYALKEHRRGARSFDVGCFQINFKWHGKAFASIEEMFDPMKNALYAARFLGQLHAETGSWNTAAGAYHSRNPEFAQRYQARFERFRTGLAQEDDRDIPDIPDIVLAANGGLPGTAGAVVDRANRFPLLQRGSGAALGSLVPIGNGGGISLFGPGPSRPTVAGDDVN